MQMEKADRRKLNNKGLTLVEVIIAMVILAVTITALVSVLISSYRYNAMANARQHATLAAESIMESFKGYDIENLCSQFAGVGGYELKACKLAAGGTKSAIGKTSTGASVELFPLGKFTRPTTHTYEFTLTKIQSEHAQYDATISVTPFAGTNQSLVGMKDIHKYLDAIYRSSTVHEAKAKEQIAQKFLDLKTEIAATLTPLDPQLDYTEADIVDSYNKILERKTIIKINKGATNTTATIEMKYYIAVEGYEYYETLTSTVKDKTINFPATYVPGNPETGYCISVILDIPTSATEITFYNNSNAAKLERVFVYYYPVYVAKHTDAVKDVIEFQTSGFEMGRTLECYLLKQLPSESVMSETTVGVKEGSYNPDVRGTSILNLVHNFNENIGGGILTTMPDPQGFASKRSYMNNDLTKAEYQLMYDVNVEIRESGTTNVLATLQGTKMD